jgi:hypothetical protein
VIDVTDLLAGVDVDKNGDFAPRPAKLRVDFKLERVLIGIGMTEATKKN